ncbi:hypothetical protein LZ31DRAFT_200949 [Colletotrichum somersetense]|nr:hypothetical protein LZ31DRAFT_200949 [Colletotrichum somersetense]
MSMHARQALYRPSALQSVSGTLTGPDGTPGNLSHHHCHPHTVRRRPWFLLPVDQVLPSPASAPPSSLFRRPHFDVGSRHHHHAYTHSHPHIPTRRASTSRPPTYLPRWKTSDAHKPLILPRHIALLHTDSGRPLSTTTPPNTSRPKHHPSHPPFIPPRLRVVIQIPPPFSLSLAPSHTRARAHPLSSDKKHSLGRNRHLLFCRLRCPPRLLDSTIRSWHHCHRNTEIPLPTTPGSP